MINLTERPIVLAEGTELDMRIRRGISRIYGALEEKYDVLTWKENRKRTSAMITSVPSKAFCIYFDPEKLPLIPYGDEFIQKLAEIAQLGPQNEGMGNRFKQLIPFLASDAVPAAHTAIVLKGFIKLLLFSLWAEKAIILPFRFIVGGSAISNHAKIFAEFETEVAAFFRKYKVGDGHRPETAAPLPASGKETLYWFGPRLIWTTDYHRFEDVKITELSEFDKDFRQLQGNVGKNLIRSSKPPMTLIIREMLTCYPERVKYDASDLDAYALWAITPSFRDYPFSDFLRDRKELTDRITNQKAEAKKAKQRDWYSKQPPRSPSPFKQKKKIKEGFNDLVQLTGKQDHEALVEYYCGMRGVVRNGLRWLKLGAPYPGREHINLQSLGALWLEAWLAYAKYRKVICGYESEEGPVRAFNLLCDYLFLYLPWWKELFQNAEIEVPLAPKQLKRGLFIHRTQLDDGESVSIEKMPLTFLDLLPRRQHSADSRYGTLSALLHFFEWLETGFEEDDRIAGKGYKSPLRRLDLPRVAGNKKTNKIPFSKRVYPHLIFYVYAIEAFGEYLQQVALERPDVFAGKRFRQLRFLTTGPTPEQVDNLGYVSEEFLEDWPENFGYIPFVTYRGQTYPIYRVPNLYSMAERDVDLERFIVGCSEVVRRWIPHLTTLRLLIGAIETGLRLQSLQWLDLRNWDSLNRRQGIPPCYAFNMKFYEHDHFASWLTVSTDKTKEESWDVLTAFRVRSCFHREQYFRESIKETGMNALVDYEGIEGSRFGQILPLFRSHCTPNPVGDTTYDKYWKVLMWSFEEHFNNNVSKLDGLVQFVYIKGTDEKPVLDYNDMDITLIRVINTPHSCRATYSTNRTGPLEVSDVAQQLGHANTVTTAHYAVSTPEIMEEKLAAAEQEIWSSFSAFDYANPAYIRADKPNGSLCKSFQENRTAAIEAFQFAPAVSMWSTDDLNTVGIDGLQMLKSSPMSQIFFRETHICPVGEVCPSDVLLKIGEPRRCGICPLAMRCVDHLPAISAKISQLKMKVRTGIKRAEQLTEMGEPLTSIDQLYDAADLDTNEAAGWKFSHDILQQMQESRLDCAKVEYYVESPELVQKHLRIVTTNRTVSEFLLHRIAEANAYPTLADPEIQRIAERFCRYLLADNYQSSVNDDPVTVLASLVKTQMEPLGLTIADLAKRIDQLERIHEEARPALMQQRIFLLDDEQEAS